jgi:2-dehydro-3-deoxyphosphogluconate aldolase/(4S)-4-hydroxy-2-oxoglutarate aldolase
METTLEHMSPRERAVYLTRSTGVLPAMKLKQKEDVLPWVHAMYLGGARVVEITMTSPGVLEHFEAIRAEFGDRLFIAAGTCLDASAARAAILAGARVIVSPAVVPEVIATAHRYGAACFSGAFTATEVLQAMQLGAQMVKVFPAALGGPKYMTNLKMVYPEVSLIPSGGISPENAGEFIKCGASAISGARNFFDREAVESEGAGWITRQVQLYIDIVARARDEAAPLP